MRGRENASMLGSEMNDPTIPPRIVPVAVAMVALVLADHLLRQRAVRM
ncbi:MAG: Chorismate synthase [Euryarchaeota archaeon]|nr:Chorismate synthase [Euryarchaeota archaeon]